MKATYRAKFNALCAMNDGYSFITIKRYNEEVSVWLDDIIDTPNGNKVVEYGKCICQSFKKQQGITYRELMNYTRNN